MKSLPWPSLRTIPASRSEAQTPVSSDYTEMNTDLLGHNLFGASRFLFLANTIRANLWPFRSSHLGKLLTLIIWFTPCPLFYMFSFCFKHKQAHLKQNYLSKNEKPKTKKLLTCSERSWSVLIDQVTYSIRTTLIASIFPLLNNYEYMISESESCAVVSDSLWPHGLYSPWSCLGQNTGLSSLSLLQGIFPTQELNQGLQHYRWILYRLSYQILLSENDCIY